MSEPSLAITTDINDVYQTPFWGRLKLMLTGQDEVFSTWAQWAYDGNDTDYQWFADRYSGYVMQYEYDNTQAVIATADYGTLWNNNESGVNNGWCM